MDHQGWGHVFLLFDQYDFRVGQSDEMRRNEGKCNGCLYFFRSIYTNFPWPDFTLERNR